MRDSLANEIISYISKYKSWQTELIVPHNGNLINISSAAQGKKSTIPKDAPDQPSLRHPPSTVYRFDTRFKGVDAICALKDMLRGFKCCPGCQIVVAQSSNIKRTSSVRSGNWTLACSHGLLQTDAKPGAFVEGDYAMKNIKKQTIKKQKSTGSSYRDVEGMYGKKTRELIRNDKSAEASQKKKKQSEDELNNELNRRTVSGRAQSKKTQCAMKLIIFLNKYDDYFYLSDKSSLEHNDHPYIEPKAIPRSEKDLNDDEKSFLNTLYNLRASNSMISQIFQHLKGREFGTFIPKTIYNMNKKSQDMLDIAQYY